MNHFNNKQCLLLRKCLFPLTQSMKQLQIISPKVVTLLEFINPTVSLKDVELAFFGSFVQEEDNRQEWKTATVEENQEETNFFLFTKEDIGSQIDELVNTYEIDESVAKACFLHITPFEIKKALQWCKENADNDDVYDDADKFDEKMENMYSPDE